MFACHSTSWHILPVAWHGAIPVFTSMYQYVPVCTTSGFLPGTTSYVYVRCRTYTLRHRTADVRCRVQHRTYDIVRTILHTILHVRHRTFVNIVGATYDIVRPTYDIVGSGKSMSYTMSYVSQNLRCRTFENVYRIRCRRCLSYTMSYVFP